jgi:hypothetical protein
MRRSPLMNRLRSLAFKLNGAPPPTGSPKSQQLRWIRGFYLKPLPLVFAVDVMVLVRAAQACALFARRRHGDLAAGPDLDQPTDPSRRRTGANPPLCRVTSR